MEPLTTKSNPLALTMHFLNGITIMQVTNSTVTAMECFPLPPIPIVSMQGNVFSMGSIKRLQCKQLQLVIRTIATKSRYLNTISLI